RDKCQAPAESLPRRGRDRPRGGARGVVRPRPEEGSRCRTRRAPSSSSTARASSSGGRRLPRLPEVVPPPDDLAATELHDAHDWAARPGGRARTRIGAMRLFSQDTKVQALKGVPLFEGLSRRELVQLERVCEDLEVEQGTVLCKEGDV